MPSRWKFWVLALAVLRCGSGEMRPWALENQVFERAIGGHEVDRFLLAVDDGQHTHVAVEQLGADVKLELVDSLGGAIASIDGINGASGWEELHFVSDRRRTITVQVSRFYPGFPSRYRLIVSDQRSATASDRSRWAAHRSLEVAEDLRSQRNWPLAAENFQAVAQIASRMGDRGLEATALDGLATATVGLGSPRKALSLWQAAIATAKAGGRRDLLPALLNRLGQVASNLELKELALQSFEQASAAARAVNELREEANAINSLALVGAGQGRLWNALRRYSEALARYRTLGDQHAEAAALLNRGQIYTLLDRPQQAQIDFERSLKGCGSDPRDRAARLLELGWIDAGLRSGGGDSARKRGAARLKQALDLFREAKDQSGEAGVLDRLGTVARLSGFAESAHSLHRQALAIQRQLDDPRSLVAILGSLAEDEIALKRFDRALTYLDEAKSRTRSLDAPFDEVFLWSSQGEALQGLGRLDEAVASHEAALDRFESLYDDAKSYSFQLQFLATAYDIYGRALAARVDLHQRDPERGHSDAALEIVERSRARSLAALLSSPRRYRSAEEETLADEISRNDSRWRWLADSGSPASVLAAVEAELRELELSYELAEARAPNVSGPPLSREVVTERKIRGRLLDSDTAMVYFILGEERSLAWVVRRDRPTTMVALPRLREIEEIARPLVEALEKSAQRWNEKQAVGLAAKLADQILAPLAAELTSHRLVFVPDGVLHSVPFAYLPHPNDPSREPLLRNHEVVVLPSATVLDAVRDRPLASPQHLLAVVGDPSYRGGTFGPLSEAAAEAREILALAGARGPTVSLLGARASRASVLREGAEWMDSRVAHFVVHGFFDSHRPPYSGLALSPRGQGDSLLYAWEISRLRIEADLVVLSACDSGRGEHFRGEGLVGLPQSLLAAGARRVAVSLWKVDGEATRTLMVRFYRALLEDELAPAAALREAQLSMLDEPRWQSPANWAAFTLVGDWRPMPLASPKTASLNN